MATAREIVLYLPTGGDPATADIVRGSAIVGRPRFGSQEMTVYFEGTIYDHENVRTLADRATQAAGRLVERYPTVARRVVSRDALTAVGSFDLGRRRIILTGPHSERAVAEWLGTVRLDPAELRPSPGAIGAGMATVDAGLLHELMRRGGVRAEGHEWVTSDGRRTSAVGDALLWALENIAQGRS
ncbi:MAG TPA: hypothetical protein VH275_04895 [Solirubrobacterales bacterium]|jgi:hypothetical protein|nr:hypothetical protein [Solirubrobacterales bacterium]